MAPQRGSMKPIIKRHHEKYGHNTANQANETQPPYANTQFDAFSLKWHRDEPSVF